MYICIGFISVVCCIMLKRENDRRDRGERDEVIKGVNDERHDLMKNGCYASVEEARRKKGDKWSGFRYRLWSPELFRERFLIGSRQILYTGFSYSE